ncbi:MAG: MoaD/ThiS family protein [Crenarchaeota archaeon]|nr:MoaD/ThiS family protein [Thermoproteota archaeon]
MRVTVVFLARAGQVTGKHLAKIELPEGATINDLLEEIGRTISKRFYRGVKEGRLVFTIFVNGKPVDEPNYRLKNGDRVVFTTPEMGG